MDSAAGFRRRSGGGGGGGGREEKNVNGIGYFYNGKKKKKRKKEVLSHFDGIGSKMTDLILIIIIITDRFLFSAVLCSRATR